MQVFRTNGGSVIRSKRSEPSLAESVEELNRTIEKLARQRAVNLDDDSDPNDPAIRAMTAYSGDDALVKAIRRQRKQERQSGTGNKRRPADDAVAAMTEFSGPDAVQRMLKQRRAG